MDDAVIFRDELWACEVTPGYDVPGWVILRVRRHAVGWQSLTTAELDSFGHRAQQVVGAVTDATGAAATYLVTFGESHPHFHVLITARGHNVPPELRAGNILQLRHTALDRTAALKLVPAIRAAYEAAS